MEPKDYVDIVYDLNTDLFYDDETNQFLYEWGCVFTYKTDGYSHIIEIMDFTLWNSNNDERDYIEEEEDKLEPLETYIKRKFKELVKIYQNEKLKMKMIKEKKIKEKKKYPWWHILFHQWDVRRSLRQCSICKKRQYRVFLDSGILSGWFDLD